MLVLKVFNWGLIAPGRQLSLVGKHLLILKNSTMPKHPDSVYSLNITPLLILLMLKVEGSLFRGNINHSHVVLQQQQFLWHSSSPPEVSKESLCQREGTQQRDFLISQRNSDLYSCSSPVKWSIYKIICSPIWGIFRFLLHSEKLYAIRKI